MVLDVERVGGKEEKHIQQKKEEEENKWKYARNFTFLFASSRKLAIKQEENFSTTGTKPRRKSKKEKRGRGEKVQAGRRTWRERERKYQPTYRKM